MKKIQFNFKKYRFEIYSKPGVWMNEKDLKRLQERLSGIAEKRLKTKPRFSFFKDVRYLNNKLVVICADKKTKDDCSCCVLSYLGTYRKRSVIHCGAVYSNAENQGTMKLLYGFAGLYIMIKNLFFRKVYVTSLTHVPKIFGMFSEQFYRVYPDSRTGREAGNFHLKIKDLFFNTYIKEWDLSELPQIDGSFVIRGFRLQDDGTMLYPDTVETVPRHRKVEYNTRCFNLLDYENGDEVFQVGIFPGIFGFIMKNRRSFRHVPV